MNLAAVRAVALAVFKESVRDRVPYSLVLFAVVLMAAAFLMSRLTAAQDLKVTKDLGLATMNVIGLLIALFIGTGLVAKEVERRSIYGVLAKPLSRTSVPARQVLRPGPHPGGQPRADDRRVLRDAALPGTVDHRAGCSRGGGRRPSTCGCCCRSVSPWCS